MLYSQRNIPFTAAVRSEKIISSKSSLPQVITWKSYKYVKWCLRSCFEIAPFNSFVVEMSHVVRQNSPQSWVCIVNILCLYIKYMCGVDLMNLGSIHHLCKDSNSVRFPTMDQFSPTLKPLNYAQILKQWWEFLFTITILLFMICIKTPPTHTHFFLHTITPDKPNLSIEGVASITNHGSWAGLPWTLPAKGAGLVWMSAD